MARPTGELFRDFVNTMFEPDGDIHETPTPEERKNRDIFAEWANTALNGQPASKQTAGPAADQTGSSNGEKFAQWYEETYNPPKVDKVKQALEDLQRASDDVARAYGKYYEAQAERAAEERQNQPPDLPAAPKVPDGGEIPGERQPHQPDPIQELADIMWRDMAFDPRRDKDGWKRIV